MMLTTKDIAILKQMRAVLTPKEAWSKKFRGVGSTKSSLVGDFYRSQGWDDGVYARCLVGAREFLVEDVTEQARWGMRRTGADAWDTDGVIQHLAAAIKKLFDEQRWRPFRINNVWPGDTTVVTNFNDYSETTHEDVLFLLDYVIAEAEKDRLLNT